MNTPSKEYRTGSAITVSAQPTPPREAKIDGMFFPHAVSKMREGEKLFRRSGTDERWVYWESCQAYMTITVPGRIDVVAGDGKILLFDWRPDLESIEANDWMVVE